MNHRYEVGFLIKDLFKKYVKNVVAYSERIIILQLVGIPINESESDPGLCPYDQ
jgi:hypothetical protein